MENITTNNIYNTDIYTKDFSYNVTVYTNNNYNNLN